MPGISAQTFYGPGAQMSSSWLKGYSKDDMGAVWRRTGRVCGEGFYCLGKKTVDLEPFLSDCVKKTFKRTASVWRWLVELLFGKTYRPLGHQTSIKVMNQDALEVAIALKKKGYNPALLNPANARTPGGGYTSGSRAMEEDICRRSGLAFAIDKAHKKAQNFYPLKGPELLYSPDVPIFRHGRDKAYAYMEAPVPVSIITSAAIDLHPDHKAGLAYRNDKKAFQKETERRIYDQLAVAADRGNNAVVLTAFGCGAFQNLPTVVAQIYRRVIYTHFKGVFKEIVFAVIDDHNSGHAHNPQGNFTPFKQILEN